MKSIISLDELEASEIKYLLELAKNLKKTNIKNISKRKFVNKNIALLFEKPSTRTRCSFEVAAAKHGINTTYLGPNDIHLNVKETIEDTARVLERMYDGIAYRGTSQQKLKVLDDHTDIPVWNSLTNMYHPTQILADLLTVRENIETDLESVKITFVGDCKNNIARSLINGCKKIGYDLTLLGPKKLLPGIEGIKETNNIEKGVKNSDVIYTDVWFSVNDDKKDFKKKIELLEKYKVDTKMMNLTHRKTIFMHCLPAIHTAKTEMGKRIKNIIETECGEVTDEVFESKNSVVFDQAENRLHTIRAILVATFQKN